MDKGKAKQIDIENPDRIQDSPLSYNQLIQALLDFFQVAFHTILCLRGVYPHHVFSRRKKYQHACYQSRHPGLNEYIGRVIQALKLQLENSTVAKVILVIRSQLLPSDDNHHLLYERFIFSLDYLIDSSAIDPRNRDLAISSNLSSKQVDAIFRGFLQKLMVVDAILYNLPPTTVDQDELTFAILLEMRDGQNPLPNDLRNQSEFGDWIPSDPENIASSTSTTNHHNKKKNTNLDDISTPPSLDQQNHRPTIRPIKTFDSGVINMMLYVEENTYAKTVGLGHSQSHPSNPPPPLANRATGHTHHPSSSSSLLLQSKASQLDHHHHASNSKPTTAKDVSNRAKRLDAERDLDQPPLAHLEVGRKRNKKKRASMTLGDTRAAESDSQSSDDSSDAPVDSSPDLQQQASPSEMT